MAKHNEIGKLGEDIASKHLENKGFKLVARNYHKKWGEIDIVAQKDTKIYFIEVKTVTRPEYKNDYRPEDNLHLWKQQRLKRAIQSFIMENFKKKYPNWQFDLICVYLDPIRKIAKIRYNPNIILGV